METIKVKVIEGKVYLADSEDFDTVELTTEEWESLDKSLEYSIQGENLIVWDDTPIEQPVNVPSLETMYVQNDCHWMQMVHAIWDFQITGNKAAIEEIEAKRANVRAQHQKLQNA